MLQHSPPLSERFSQHTLSCNILITVYDRLFYSAYLGLADTVGVIKDLSFEIGYDSTKKKMDVS